MTKSNRGNLWTALALSAVLGATVSVFPTQAPAAEKKEDQKKQSISDAVRKQMVDAQKALQAKDWPTVLAKTTEAAAIPKKTPFDQHVIDEWQGYGYANTGEWAQAAPHFEATLNDGFLAPSETLSRLELTTQSYYNAYVKTRDADKARADGYLDKVTEYGNKAIDGGAPSDFGGMVVSAYYIKDKYKEAATLQQKLIDEQMQKGETPSTDSLDMLRSAYYKSNNDAGLFQAFKLSLKYHPKPDLWDQILGQLSTPASRNTDSELQLYRLMLEAGVLKRSSDYTEFADNALRSGSPGEAKAVLEKGFADNVFTDAVKADNKKMLASATTKAAADQADLGKEVPKTGQQAYALGYAYFGYKQYDKAAELLSKAVSQGGLKNEPNARLLLGISQLKAGHPDDALKTFETVKGDPALEQIAQLWPYAVTKP